MTIRTFPCGYLQTNAYLVYNQVTKEGFVVDPGDVCRELDDFVEKEGIRLTHILLTHGHSDHTGGLAHLKRRHPHILCLASEKEKDFLLNHKNAFASEGILCDLYVKDGDSLELAGVELVFLETPGHTPGGMSILAGDVLFSGDTLFRASIGRSDFPGGNHAQLVRSIKEKLFTLPDHIRVLPGHDIETTIGYEKRSNPFV